MPNHYFAMLARLKHINRWGLMRNTHSENLSEHSLETAFIAHALCIISNVRLGTNLDASDAALRAMFHDTTEIITGDMPTPIKYDNEEIKSAYKKIEALAGERLLCLLPDDIRPHYEPFYEEKCDDIAKIVKAADKISALIKCIEESRMGNSEFAFAEKTLMESIKKMELPAAEIFLEEFLPSYRLTLDEQN